MSRHPGLVNFAMCDGSTRSIQQTINKKLNSLAEGYNSQGCSTLWNRQDFEQVIDARQSSAVTVLAEGAGLF